MFNCSYNHYQVYNLFKNSGLSNALVVEDDLVFMKNVDAIEKLLIERPADADLVVYDKFMPSDRNGVELKKLLDQSS